MTELDWVFEPETSLNLSDTGERLPIYGTLSPELSGWSLGWAPRDTSHFTFVTFRPHQAIVNTGERPQSAGQHLTICPLDAATLVSPKDMAFGRQLLAVLELLPNKRSEAISKICVIRDLLRLEVLFVHTSHRVGIMHAGARLHLSEATFSRALGQAVLRPSCE